MRTRELLAVVATAALLGAACTENPDPRRPTIKQMETQGFGGWIDITTTQGWAVRGELISVRRDFIHVLRMGQPGNSLVYVRTAEIANAKLYKYVSEGGVGVAGFFGTLSTISHGFFLIFTAPIWIIASGIAASTEANHVVLEYPDDDLSELAAWARFPQGLPPGLDEESLVVPRSSRTPKRPSIQLAPTEAPLTPPSTTPSVPVQLNPSMLFQQARTAAAANDCAKVLEISGTVQLADQPFWDAVFSKDVSIRRCLGL